MLVPVVLLVLGWLGWLLTRHVLQFPSRFASLLSHAELGSHLATFLTGRSCVAGRFRDRAVTMAFERADEYRTGYVLVGMAVDAPDQPVIQGRSLHGTELADEELERALFALESKHELRVSVEAGQLRALWQPVGLFIFPGRFDRSKWLEVLDGMHVVCSKLDRRADSQPDGRRE